jgi:hypothetical protein
MNCLIIPCVEFPSYVTYEEQPRYVANIFWKQNIAKINDITLIPYWRNGVVVYVGFITILEWLDTENSYNFIKKLNDPSREARIIYDDDDWWVIQLNTGNESNFAVENYTVYFSYPTDFELENEEEDFKVEEVEVEEVKVEEEVKEEIILKPVIERAHGEYSCAVCHTGESGPFSLCYNIDCSEFMKNIKDYSDTTPVFIPMNVLDLEYDSSDDLPVLVQSSGEWTCSECKEYTGSMYSVCRNQNCNWFNMTLLQIVNQNNNEQWRPINPEKTVCFDDVPPNVIPPMSWLKDDDMDFDMDMNFDMDFNTDTDTDIPVLEFENTHECGHCYKPKRNTFSVCWNVMCERYGKNIDEAHPNTFDFDNFNFDTRNVTFRKSNNIEV